MSKYKKDGNGPSVQTEDEALKLARAIQKPGQTKEQTKLIAQGIKKGIDLYKKKQGEKNREMDRSRKKVRKEKVESSESVISPETVVVRKQHWLPWVLLGLSWAGMAFYLL